MGFSRQKLGPALGWLWYLISRGQSFLPAWYVDSEAGNDNNSGTSPSDPFQTLAKVQSVLQDGDKVRLKRGSHWRETLTLTKEGVDINAYGSGPLPLIDCSDVIPAASWTLTAGKTKVYQASVPIETPNTGATFLNVWEDDAYLVRVASVDECEATPGSYYPSTESVSPITLYIHPTGSTNPATNGRRYEYSRRKHAIQTFDNCTVANVRTRRNLDSYGSLYIAPNNVITDCVAEDGGIHNLLVMPPGRLVRVTAKNCYAGSNPLIMFVHFLPVANGEPVEYIGCRAENNQVLPFSTGFGGHRGTSGELGTATYTDCSASNLSSAFTPQQGDAVFERPVLENVTWGFSPSGGQTYAITGASGTVTDRFVSIVSGSGSVVVVEDSQINASMSSGLGFVCTVAGNSIICRDSEINARSALLMSQAGTVQMLQNTINAGAIYVYSIVSGVNLESNHNNFTGITLFTIDGQSKTIDEYRSITGQDANSLPPPAPGPPSVAYTSVKSGNWSDPTTWNPSGVPDDGDTVTIATGHTITVDQDVTIGNSGSPARDGGTPAITTSGTAKLIVGAGRTLRLRGCMLGSTSTVGHYWLDLQAGAVLEFDSSQSADPMNTKYAVGPGATATTGGVRFLGTSSTRCTVRSAVGSAPGYFDQAASGTEKFYSLSFWAEYTDFERVGDATTPLYRGTANNPNIPLYVDHCSFDTCGTILRTITSATSIERLRHSVWKNSQTSPVHIAWVVGVTTGTREIVGCVFDRRLNAYPGAGTALFGDCTITDNYVVHWVDGPLAPTAHFDRNLIIANDEVQGGVFSITTLKDNYWIVHQKRSDPHFADTRVRAGAAIEVSGNIIDSSGVPDGSYDGLLFANPTSVTTVQFTRNIAIPSGNPNGNSLLCTPHADAANLRLYCERNTVVTNSSDNGAFRVTTPAQTGAGVVQAIRDNLCITRETADPWPIFWQGTSGTVQDFAVPANCRNNASNAYGGYENGSYSTPPGENDFSIDDPQFIDDRRNLLTWDTLFLGNSAPDWSGAASYAVGDIVGHSAASWYGGERINYRCIQAHSNVEPGVYEDWRLYWEPASFYRIREALAAGTTYDGLTPIQKLVAWVREGFTPRNPALKGAGYQGGDVGAMDIPDSGDLPTEDLVNLISFGVNPTEASGEWYSPKRNLLLWSEDLTNAPWSKVGAGTGTAPVVTSGQADPDGGSTAFRIQMDRGTGTTLGDASIIREQAVIPVAASLCPTVWMRSFDGTSTYSVILTADAGGANFPTVTVDGTWRELSTSTTGLGFEISLRGGTGSSQTADILVWHPQLTAGSSPVPYEKTTINQTMWDWSPNAAHGTRGNAGTPDSFDPRFLLVGGKISGLEFVTDDQVITSNLSGVSMAGDWTAYLVGKFAGAGGVVWSLANGSASDQYQAIRYSASGSLIVTSRSGATENVSAPLAVPPGNFTALALISNGGTLTLKRLDTGDSISVANANPSGTPRLGFGCLAVSTVSSRVDSLHLVYTVLYAAAHEDAVQNTVYDILKQRALSERAVSVL